MINQQRKLIWVGILSLFLSTSVHAQKIVKLWEGNPPTSNNITESEVYYQKRGWMTNIAVPELHIYLPEGVENTGTAVVICPGGGYSGLAFEHEGIKFAQWLNKRDIAGIVLKYRMPNKHKEIPLDDAWQAMRYVRSHASELGIKSDKIGIAGFSAGGHLASTVSTHFTTSGVSTSPDFSILFYPVITMEAGTHGGSKYNLLGEDASPEDVYTFSNEKQVSEKTPPTILLLSDDDKGVKPANSIAYYEALKKNNIEATMYIFPKGGHGWGMRETFKYHTQMLTLLEMWLKDIQKNK